MIWGLAPMDGITNCAYRIVVKQIFERYNKNSNDELRLRTEFMSAE
jgi:tRNA-dihydrouridine synthase